MDKKYQNMSNQDLGDYFEDKVRTALQRIKLSTNQGIAFHRFYDSKSAGTFLPEQPADFLVGAPTGAYLLEAKASFEKESLSSCLASAVRSGQAASAKLWCHSGPYQRSLFLFFCAKKEMVEIWDGEFVADTFIRSGARLSAHQVWMKGGVASLPDMLTEVLL